MKHIGFILGSVLLAGSASADITFKMAEKGTSVNDGGATTLMIADGKVKMQESGEGSAMIYDSASDTFSTVDHKRKMFMVVDKETAAAVSDQMAEAMKQVEAQMAALPEAQRKMLMEQMKSRMPGMSAAMSGDKTPRKTTVDWTGDSREIAGYKCKVATLSQGDGEITKACIADREAIGISTDDFETMASMMDALMAMAGPLADALQMPSLREIDGVPIATDIGKQESELVSVSKDSIAASEFEIPSDYKQQSMAGM